MSTFLLILISFWLASSSFGLTAFARRCRPPTSLRLFGMMDQVESMLFDSLTKTTSANKDDTNPRKEFCLFLELEQGTSNNIIEMEAARESLMRFLQLWARQLEDDPKGLATPIVVSKDFQAVNITDLLEYEEETRIANQTWMLGDDIDLLSNINCSLGPSYSMKLQFRPPKRYLSYKEQRGMEKGVLPDRKGAKVDAWSPGGIELLVHVATDAAGSKESQILSLQALRCDIDGDTIIKFSSERAIIRRLREAIRIWKKVRAMK